MIVNRTLMATLLAVTFSLFGTSAFAAIINVQNADFSDGVDIIDGFVPDDTGVEMYDSWDSYSPVSGGDGSSRRYGRYSSDGTNYATQDHVAYIDLKSSGSEDKYCHTSPTGCIDGQYIVGIQQFLDPLLDEKNSLQKNSKYELSVLVGDPKSGGSSEYDEFGGYRIELLVDGLVVAEDDNTLLWIRDDPDGDNSPPIDEGAFKEASLTFTTGDSLFVTDPVDDTLQIDLIGRALGIRLISKNAVRNPVPMVYNFNWGIGFDDVSLTVSAVPVPAAVWLFGTALVGLFGVGKRRKTAQSV